MLSPRRRKRRELLIGVAAVVAFLVALGFWIGHDADDGVKIGALPTAGPAAPSAAEVTASASVSPTVTPSASAGTPSTAGPTIGSLKLAPLPGSASDVNSGPHGTHVVTVKVTSDATILQFGYVIRGGSPPEYYRQYIKSPATFRLIAHGDGIVAQVGAQASPNATRVSCVVTVDGRVTQSNTAKGGYGVAFCVG